MDDNMPNISHHNIHSINYNSSIISMDGNIGIKWYRMINKIGVVIIIIIGDTIICLNKDNKYSNKTEQNNDITWNGCLYNVNSLR